MASFPMHAPQPTPSPKLGSIVLLASLTAFGAVSVDLYLPSLPAIGVALEADAATVAQSLSSFLVGMALGQLVLGPLSDRFGRRPVLLVGAVVYIAASFACAAAPTIGWLIAGRFVQALGACAGQVVARAIVRDRYDHQDSARIFSLITLVFGITPMVAPTAGAWLLTFGSWRTIFLVLAVFGAVTGAAVALRLSESRSPATALQAASESVVSAYLGLLGRRRLVGYLLAGALNGATLFTYIAAAPDLLIDGYGFTPREFGWIFTLLAVGVIGASQINRWLLGRYASDTVLGAASLVGVACGLGLLAVVLSGFGGVYGILVMLFAILASFGFMAANANAGALGVDPLRAGTTSALIGGASFSAGAVAGSVVGAFHDGTAVPMAAVMAVCLAGAALALHALALPRSPAEIDP